MQRRTRPRLLSFAAALAASALSLGGCGSSPAPTGSGGSASASSSTGGGGAGGEPPCHRCGDPEQVGQLANAAIDEASGIAASALHPGHHYVHNDSGDSARFFAIGPAGEDRGSYQLEGVTAFDWEDMARGPCAGEGSCLYFADFGDNAFVQSDYVIHRVAEPASLSPGVHSALAESFRFVYPEGATNAEALLVHPQSGDVYIFTKDASRSRLHRLAAPLDASRVATAEYLGEVAVPDLLPLVTGGDFAPDGSSVLLRTYTSLWRYPVEPGESLAAALARPPCAMPVAVEKQGEAVAWSVDGKSYLTVGESVNAALNRVRCE